MGCSLEKYQGGRTVNSSEHGTLRGQGKHPQPASCALLNVVRAAPCLSIFPFSIRTGQRECLRTGSLPAVRHDANEAEQIEEVSSWALIDTNQYRFHFTIHYTLNAGKVGRCGRITPPVLAFFKQLSSSKTKLCGNSLCFCSYYFSAGFAASSCRGSVRLCLSHSFNFLLGLRV